MKHKYLRAILGAALTWIVSSGETFGQEEPALMNCKKWKAYDVLPRVEGISAAKAFWLEGFTDGLILMAMRSSVLLSSEKEKNFAMLISVMPKNLSTGAIITEVNARCDKLPENMPVGRIIADIALGH